MLIPTWSKINSKTTLEHKEIKASLSAIWLTKKTKNKLGWSNMEPQSHCGGAKVFWGDTLMLSFFFFLRSAVQNISCSWTGAKMEPCETLQRFTPTLGLYCQHQLQDISSLLTQPPRTAGTHPVQYGYSAADRSAWFLLFNTAVCPVHKVYWWYAGVRCRVPSLEFLQEQGNRWHNVCQTTSITQSLRWGRAVGTALQGQHYRGKGVMDPWSSACESHHCCPSR